MGVVSVYTSGLQNGDLLSIVQHIYGASAALMLLCWISRWRLLLI